MRLFVAMELSTAVKQVLRQVQRRLSPVCDGVKWIGDEQLHLTVKFLGDAADDRVPEMCESVTAVAADTVPFDLRLSGCGCFPPGGAVRIVWAGGTDESGVLVRCVDALEARFERVGFPRERKPFSPHITIGRVRRDRSGGRLRAAVDACSFEPMVQPIASMTLMSSVLSPRGPTYSRVHKTRFE